MKQKKVWILSGIPGSGKSTWVKEQIAKNGGIHCSRDEIRFSLLKDDEDYFAHEFDVINIWHNRVVRAILDPEVENIYIDATHLTEKTRKKTINALPQGEYEIVVVFFDIPVEVCIARNEKRTGRAYVPPQVIRDMHARYSNHTTLANAIHIEWEGNK